MNFRPTILAGAVAAAVLAPLAAEAAQVTGNVNLRTGPGTGYAVITTIPAGAPIQVGNCAAWCSVTFRGMHGFVSSDYVVGSARPVPPQAAYPRRPPPPSFGYARKPWWDAQRHAWYDGRRWYANGRWYDRPTFSLQFNIH